MTVLGLGLAAIGGAGVVGFSLAAAKERIPARESRFLMVAGLSLLLVYVGTTMVQP